MKTFKNKTAGLLILTLIANAGCSNQNATGKYQIAGDDHQTGNLLSQPLKTKDITSKQDQARDKNGKGLIKKSKGNQNAAFLKALNSLMPLTPKEIEKYRDLKDSRWINSVQG